MNTTDDLAISDNGKTEAADSSHIEVARSVPAAWRDHPKLWSPWIRWSALVNVCIFAFLGNTYSAGLATAYLQLITELHMPPEKFASLLAYSLLALGLGPLLWVPTSEVMGKRPVIVMSLIVFLLGSIWSTVAKSYGSLLGSRIFACLGAGSVEVLGPAIIGDLFFERSFATAMGVYSISVSAGAQVGPLIAGYIVTDHGWRWFFKLTSILGGANLLCTLLFLPETAFFEVVQNNQTAADMDENLQRAVESETIATPTSGDDSLQAPIQRRSVWNNVFYLKHPYVQGGGVKQWFQAFILPFTYTLDPPVLFGSVVYGTTIGWIGIISALSAQLLSPPPYLYTPAKVGVFTVTTMIGVVLAYPIAGPLADSISKYLRKRNGGHHRPEHRLITVIFAFLTGPAGLFAFAWSLADHHSTKGAAAGYSLQAASLTLIPTAIYSYLIDIYPGTRSEVVVFVNAAFHLITFGMTLKAPNWLASSGLKSMFAQMAGIQLGILALFLPWYIWGEQIRKSTARLRPRAGVALVVSQ